MNIHNFKPVIAGASLLVTSFFSSTSFADTFNVDPVHSIANFSVGHLGLAKVQGRFNDVSGSFSYDPTKPENTEVTIVINANSVDSNHDKRDQHLRSPDFFDAKQFPKIVFKSTQYTGNKSLGLIEGDLTMHGITKKMTFSVQVIGEGNDPWGGYRMGALVTGSVKRSEFGIDYFIPGVSDEVSVVFSVEAIRQ